MNNNFERIADYLQYEGIPKTPQEIHKYTEIGLGEIYQILQDNKSFFKEIVKETRLIGWII